MWRVMLLDIILITLLTYYDLKHKEENNSKKNKNFFYVFSMF